MPVFICQGCGSEHASWSGKCPHCGVSETIQLKQSGDRMLEKVIKGKYKIIRKLGQGGMGAVYLAEQLGIGHRVALKFLRSEFSEDAEIARRFLNEAKSYARVAHPNAVTLHDFGQDEEGNLFIAMEYCEGVDLKKILQEQKRIGLGEAIDIILQVADVLGNAHTKHVVHRDLKPENVMLRKGMRGIHVKVLDFGIARLMNESTKLTVQGAIAGTPRYMAPEQVEGRDDVDHRADIYAVGILLYEMITGVQPFDGSTITEILRKQVVQPMPRLVSVSAELDYPEVEAVLQKACAKNRNDRFPDMMAFAHQIAQAMPTQSGKPGTGVWAGMRDHVDDAAPTVPANFPRSGTLVQHPGADRLVSSKPGGYPAVGDYGGNPSELIAPRSRTPMMIVGLFALLLIGAGGAWAMLSRGSGVVDPPAALRATIQEKIAPDPVEVGLPPPRTADEITNSRGRDALARAMAPFEVGNLDETEIFLKSVPPGTDSRPSADTLQQKIEQIREKLKRGREAAAAGNCVAATVSFKEVLKLNPRIALAQEGLVRCKNAALPPQLDP